MKEYWVIKAYVSRDVAIHLDNNDVWYVVKDFVKDANVNKHIWNGWRSRSACDLKFSSLEECRAAISSFKKDIKAGNVGWINLNHYYHVRPVKVTVKKKTPPINSLWTNTVGKNYLVVNSFYDRKCEEWAVDFIQYVYNSGAMMISDLDKGCLKISDWNKLHLKQIGKLVIND